MCVSTQMAPLSTSAPDDCLLIFALGYFELFPLPPRGRWRGAMMPVCHLVIELFPCRTSLIRTLGARSLPHLPMLTCIAGNLRQCLQPLCSAQSVQAEGIPLNSFFLLSSLCTFFPPFVPLSTVFPAVSVGKKWEII